MQALSDDSMGTHDDGSAASQGGCVDSVGDSIQHQRVAHGMSQAALAQSLGISRQSVAKWEAGKSRPELEKMIRLCSLFGCTMDELVYGVGRHVEASAEREVPAPASATNERETPDMPAKDAAEPEASTWADATRDYDRYVSRRCVLMALGWAAPVMGMGVSSLCVGLGASSSLAVTLWMGSAIAGGTLLRTARLEQLEMIEAHPHVDDFHTSDQRRAARKLQTGTYAAALTMLCAALVLSYASEWVSGCWWHLAGLSWLLLSLAVFFGVQGYQRGGACSTERYNRGSESRASRRSDKKGR